LNNLIFSDYTTGPFAIKFKLFVCLSTYDAKIRCKLIRRD
jgi:hypothetical protein